MTKRKIAPEILCSNCGKGTGSSHANRIYCDHCAVLSRSRQLPHLIENSRRQMREYQRAKAVERGDARFSGHEIECERCSVKFPRKGAGQKYCKTCGPVAAKERDKRLDEAKRRRNGRVLVGDTTQCKYCAGDFTKEGVHQVYCTPECKKAWWAANPQWVINRRMSANINTSLRGGKGGKSWQAMVPYSLDELMQHLERQFVPGMGWHNRKKWDVDHIVPLSSFEFNSPDCAEFQAAWALTNLRPLWAVDNMRKSAKRTHLI